MSQRAIFGFRDDGTPKFRIVLPGADINTTQLAQIVYDADYMAARLLYSGRVLFNGRANTTLAQIIAYPNLGYVPFCLVAMYVPPGPGVRYYQSDGNSGPFGPVYQSGGGIGQKEYLSPVYGSMNSIAGRAQANALFARMTFLGQAYVYYAIFAIPTGA